MGADGRKRTLGMSPKAHTYLLLTEPVSLGHKLFPNAVGGQKPSCPVEELPGGHVDVGFLGDL